VKRPFILGVVGVLLLAGALALNFTLNRKDQAPEPATASAPLQSNPPQSNPPPQDARTRGAAPLAPSFDVVRINPRGDVVIAGRAEARAEVHVFDGEHDIGSAVADSNGQFVLLPSAPLPSGERALSLRAQRPGEAAVESEKVTVAVAPRAGATTSLLAAGGPPGPGGTAETDNAVIVPGNSLWELAQRRYGDGARYQTIYQANRQQIRNPDLIYPGQVFVIPEADRPGH
jgi:nucleoid-associated protein YgaU